MKRFFLFILSAVLFSGCSSVVVKRDYDASVDFSSFKTFAWQHAEQPRSGDPRIDDDLNDERIRKAVTATLEAKGFEQVERTSADFQVAYFVNYERQFNANVISFGMGGGRYGRYGGVGYNTSISDYEEGNLTIDIIAPDNQKTIWRGVGTRAVYEGSNPEKASRIVNDSVDAILREFPPQQK